MSSSSRSLRVLHVSHAVNTGLAHCVADYVEYQVSRGLSVAVACPSGRLAEQSVARNATHHEWNATRMPGKNIYSEVQRLKAIVEDVKPDVVHLHCAKAGLVGRLVLRRRIPTVFSPHAWSFLAAKGLMRRVVREWERFGARWSDATVCVSAAEANTGRREGIRGRIVAVPNQIDTSAIEPMVLRHRAAIRTELGITAGQPLAVCAARLTHQKGQDVALAAWPHVRELVPNAELVLVGEGPDREKLEAANVPGVRFAGYLSKEETIRWMFAADIIMCPSRWEGMSLVPLEAAAMGRPVVASDVDGMREAITDGTGWIVPPEDVQSLAETVGKALSDPGVAFDAGQLARSYFVETQAEATSSNARLVELYEEVSAGSR